MFEAPTNESGLATFSWDDRFVQFRERAKNESGLPDTLTRVVQSSDDIDSIFGAAVGYWNQKYRFFKENLYPLENNENKVGILSDLKDVRKSANMLQSAFWIFNHNHLVPENHWRFVKKLGKICDYWGINFPPERNIRTVFNVVVGTYKLDEIISAFQPDDVDGVNAFIERTLRGMKTILDTSFSDDQKLHDLRKKGTRVMMNLFQLSCLTREQDDHRQLFQSFYILDKQLGTAHDIKVQGEIAGRPNSMCVEQETRQKTLDLITFVADQWGLSL